MAASISGSGSGSASAGKRIVLDSFLRSSLAAAIAIALLVVSASPVDARDTSTVSAGYQHSCIVTADASVKVRVRRRSISKGGVTSLLPPLLWLSFCPGIVYLFIFYDSV